MHRPLDLAATIERARDAMKREDWSEACRWWNAARTISPDHAPAYAGAANALRNAGRLGEAELLLTAAAERFADHERIAVAHAWAVHRRRDWPAAVANWETVRQRFPDNPAALLGSLSALREAGRLIEAEALLPAAEAIVDAARQRGTAAAPHLALELTIAQTRRDWPTVRRCAEAIIAHQPATPPAHIFLALARACWHLHALEPAGCAARRAMGGDPTLAEAVIIAAWVATEQGDGETALECYRKLAELQPGVIRWSLKRVGLLNWLGRVEEAASELDVLCRQRPTDPMLAAFLKSFDGSALIRERQDATHLAGVGNAGQDHFQQLSDTAPPETEWKRPLLVPIADQEVQLAEVNGAKGAILVFTGAADGVSMPLALFDRYMAALEATTVYLKDFRRLLYLRGIQSLADDYPATLAALRALLQRLGIRRLATLGNCDGAFAAIRYGVELGADRILAANPPTHFPSDPLPRLEQGRNFKRNRLAANVAPEMTDLRLFLENRVYRASIDVYFKDEDERSRDHAQRIADAPGVRLHSLTGHQPRVLHALAVSSRGFHEALGDWPSIPGGTFGP